MTMNGYLVTFFYSIRVIRSFRLISRFLCIYVGGDAGGGENLYFVAYFIPLEGGLPTVNVSSG